MFENCKKCLPGSDFSRFLCSVMSSYFRGFALRDLDGTKMRKSTNRLNLTPRTLRRIRPTTARQVFWDTTSNLALTLEPSGTSTWYFVYSRHGRPRWLRIGPVHAVTTDAARKRTRSLIGQVADGRDPQAEKQSAINADTFVLLHARSTSTPASTTSRGSKATS
jgi:Arm domain-containing DNA-binding protein